MLCYMYLLNPYMQHFENYLYMAYYDFNIVMEWTKQYAGLQVLVKPIYATIRKLFIYSAQNGNIKQMTLQEICFCICLVGLE